MRYTTAIASRHPGMWGSSKQEPLQMHSNIGSRTGKLHDTINTAVLITLMELPILAVKVCTSKGKQILITQASKSNCTTQQ